MHWAGGTPMTYLYGFGAKAYPVVWLTWALLGLSIFVCLIFAILVPWGVMARKSRSVFGAITTEPVSRGPHAVHWITIGVALTVVALTASVVGTVAVLAKVSHPGAGRPLTIEVTGEQWWWKVRYDSDSPDQMFWTANEIHIPVGRPVRVKLMSSDVIHSFWFPALTGKTDAIPGQTNVTWLEADQAGRYRGQCTEYCGLQHAHMAMELVADPPARFEAWRQGQLRNAAEPATPQAMHGQAILVKSCGACHTVRGTLAGGTTAPDLTHVMSRRTIAAGVLPTTSAGLSAWIANPQAVKPGTKMPTLYLSGPELTDLRTYMETLR